VHILYPVCETKLNERCIFSPFAFDLVSKFYSSFSFT